MIFNFLKKNIIFNKLKTSSDLFNAENTAPQVKATVHVDGKRTRTANVILYANVVDQFKTQSSKSR